MFSSRVWISHGMFLVCSLRALRWSPQTPHEMLCHILNARCKFCWVCGAEKGRGFDRRVCVVFKRHVSCKGTRRHTCVSRFETSKRSHHLHLSERMFLVCCKQLKSLSRQVTKPADMISTAILPFLRRSGSSRLRTSRT